MEELWKPLIIEGYEGLYEISNIGRIKSLPRYKHTPHGTFYLSKEKILKQTITNSGYLIVTLSNKPLNESFLAHILTVIHWVDNPDNQEFINHENGNKQDNTCTNLKWCDRSYNMKHAFATGLIKKTRVRCRNKELSPN